MEKNKPVFNTVIVLTVTLLAVKLLSAIYRVPYQNVLGDEGLYAYQQVYPIVAIVSVLSLNAVPSVISQAGENFAAGVYKLLKAASLLALLLLFMMSPYIAGWMGDPSLTIMLRTSLLVLLPFSFIAVVRGILQRENDMRYIAVSQLIDQSLRVGTILLAVWLFTKGLTIYQNGMISIFGSFLGLSGAYCYLKFSGRTIGEGRLTNSERRHFVTLTLFYSLSYLIMILWQLVDSFTVLNSLKAAGIELHRARELKGIYDRGASLIQMGLIVTTSFSLVLVPLLAKARAESKPKQMNDYASSALKITIVFSASAAVGLMNLMEPFNRFLFKSGEETAALTVYMPAIILVSLIIMYTAMLQITNDYKVQAAAVTAGLLIKLILNMILIRYFGVIGASTATVAGLFIYTAVLHIKIMQRYNIKFRHFILRFMLTLVVMTGVLQLIVHIPAQGRASAFILSLIGVAAGGMIIAAAMIKLNIITRTEWSYLPFGDKVIRLMKEA